MWIIGIALLIAFEALADIFSKEYSLQGKFLFWVLGLSGYVVANIFWLFAIRRGSGLARGAILFSVGSAIAAVLIANLWYHEKIGKVEIIGIIIGLLAIVLILWSDVVALFKS